MFEPFARAARLYSSWAPLPYIPRTALHRRQDSPHTHPSGMGSHRSLRQLKRLSGRDPLDSRVLGTESGYQHPLQVVGLDAPLWNVLVLQFQPRKLER